MQVTVINTLDNPFKLLEENVSKLKSPGLVNENFAVDDDVNIDFQICTSETTTDREILDSILINDCIEVEEKIDE